MASFMFIQTESWFAAGPWCMRVVAHHAQQRLTALGVLIVIEGKVRHLTVSISKVYM